MTPEGKVKERIKRMLDKRTNVWYMMPVTSGYGRSGAPDFILCANGKFMGVEAKAHSGALTGLQVLTHNRIKVVGGIVLTIHPDNFEELHAYLNFLGCHATTTK